MYGRKTTTYDKEKNDVWALGVSLLSMLINEDYNRYYNWERCEINFPSIRKRIQILIQMGYSKELVTFVKKMLENEEFLRPKFSDLLSQVMKNSDTFHEDVNEMSIFESDVNYSHLINKNMEVRKQDKYGISPADL